MSESSRPFASNLAVVIGINQYQNIEPLSSARHDAKRLAQILQEQYDYDVKLFTDEQAIDAQATDKQATSENIWNYLTKELPQTIKPHNDNGERVRLLFYFAGHGTPPQGEDGEGGYLLPQDAQSGKTDTFLSMKEVHDVLTHLGCHHLLIILDCCYAGAFGFISRHIATAPEELSKERYDNYIEFPAGQVIASAAHDQTAIDILKDNRGTGENSIHSPFAELLFQALEDEKTADYTKDGIKTVRELDLYLGEELPKLTKNRQICRAWCLPTYDKGEFFFQTDQFNRDDLPDAIDLNQHNNPYRGLKSFEEADRRFFFGRREVLKDLYSRINANNQPLTVVLGISGSGKSSLVKAGLIPILRDPELREETFRVEAQQNNQNSSSQTSQTSSEDHTQWRILEPIRPGASPFLTLARAMLPLAFQESDLNLEPLKQLDELLRKARRKEHNAEKLETLKTLFSTWRRTSPEDKLFLIIQHFTYLEELCQDRKENPTLEDLQALREMGLNRSRLVLDNLDELTQYCDATEKEQLHDFCNKCKTQIQSWSEVWQKDEDGQQFGKRFAEFIAKHCSQDETIKILLVIDQFEELITQCKQEERQKLLNALQPALAACRQQFRLVLTLRDDFQHYFENSEQLQNYWKNNACFRVNSMGRDQLREAIEQPAAAQDLYFETKDDKSLVVQLLDDIGDTSGALPLLSFTLSELYYKYVQKGWGDRTLRWKDYKGEDDGALGGVTKAITRKATEVYNHLVNDFVDGQAIKVEPLEVGQARQTMLRWVMLRMVTLDGGEKAKRPVLDDELTYIDTETEQWNKHRELVIDRFVDARLFVKGTNLEGKTYVEPAHDILVREWDKIRTWLGETSEPVNETKKHLKQSGQDEHLTLETPEPVNETEKQPDSKPQNKSWFGLRWPLMRRNNQPEKGQEKFNLNLQRELAIAAKKWDSVRKENPVEQNNPASSTNESAIFRRVGTAHQSSIFRRVGTAHQSSTVRQMSIVGNAHPTVVALKIGGLGAFKRISPQRLLALSNTKEAVGLLWNGDPRLPQAEQIAKSNDNWLNKLEAEFVQRSVSKERQNKIIGWSIAGIVMAGSMIFSAAVWTQWRNSELNLANSMGQYSLSLLAEQRGLEAWVQAIKAGRILQKHNTANPVVINALLANASGVVESNRLEGENIAATSFSFSPDSKTLAASRDDRMIEIWDLETGQKTHSFRGHEEGEVFGISFSPDGRFLATGSDDKMIKLWDLETGTEIHTFLGHTDLVRSISFSPDGRILASGSDDGTIKLWDLETGTEISTTEGFGNVSFSPDGKTLAFISGDGMIKLWNLETGEIRTLQVQIGSYSDLSFSSDGQTLVFGSDSGTIELWDLESAQPVLILQGDAVSFSFSSDGRTLTTASSDNMVTRWDLEMGTEVYTFRADEGDFSFVNFSPDGRTLAIGGFSETIKLVNLEKENEVWTINEVGGAIFEVSFSSDGKTLVSSGYPQRIKLWSLETGQEILIFEDSNNASSPSISLNGKTLAAINIDNKVEFWDLETGQKIPGILEHEEDAVFSVSFSPDGRTLATGSDNTINLWDLETGEKIRTLQVPNGVGSVSFSPNGRTLATDSNDNTIKLWNLETGAEIYTLQRHTDTLRSLSFSPDGKTLASGSEDRTIKLWDLETGTEIRTLQGHERSVRSVSFSPDGRTLASGSDDKTIKLWNLEEGKENDIRTLQGHTDGIGSVSFSPDGRTLVSGSADETIKLWNLDFWRLDLDALMEHSCDWVRVYLQNNPNVSESDRHLCDGISNVKPDESASAASVIPTLPPLSCNEPPLPSLPSQRPGYYKDGEYYGSIETTSPPNEQLTLILPSGDRYDGEFANGKRNGCGTYTFANGNHYVGEFLDDKFHGQGEYFGKDGKFYRGEFSEGKCQGQGTLTLADGTSKTGEWQNGNLIGGSPTDSCNR